MANLTKTRRQAKKILRRAEPDMLDKPSPPMTDAACPRCKELALDKRIRAETVQRVPAGAWAPVARDGSGKCCFDCASADGIMGMGMTFEMARIVVGNDRQEQYRLPGAPMGLVRDGLVRPSKPGDLEAQHEWLERQYWFGLDDA